jgi:hypothetical protein
MSLPHDLIEMLSAFADEGVRYLVIGGHAVSFHARPRSTKDLDLLLDAAPENIARACSALARFGVPPVIVDALRAARPDEIVWLGRPPLRVDFLLRAPALSFDSAWPRRVTVELTGVLVHFIGRDDLLANKRGTARAQDLRDVEAIERASKRSDPHPRRSKPSAVPRRRR